MSWWFILVLAAGCYACKVIGLVVLGGRVLPPVVERCLALIPAAMISALVVLNTFSTGHDLTIDARAAGVGAAVVAAWRKAPFIAVIVIGAAVTAGVRAMS
ncbi:MAG: branched-chain amino acid transporter AzlD [Ilumatobacteraceae bacterium]|jgi:branched-subunit amino acid transport protein|nr:branched-chain amino acid transporter AzlD [Ilumatobacteraceae bacterium]